MYILCKYKKLHLHYERTVGDAGPYDRYPQSNIYLGRGWCLPKKAVG